MPSTKTFAATALSAIALTGIGAQAASADSISYVKDGNVWLSTGDGSRQFQVTDRGGYSSASQSDDGTIVALHGAQRIHKLDRFGNVVADFTTAVSDGVDDSLQWGASHFEGPFDLDLSPDGTKLTYNFYWQQWNFWGNTYSHSLRKGVAVSYSDRTTSWEEPGLGVQTGWSDADWYDADTLMLSHKATSGLMDVVTDELGTDTNDGTRNWFHFDKPDGLQDMRRAKLNRQHTKVAEIADYKGQPHLDVWEMTGEAPALPGYCMGIGGPDGGKFEHISWSPDGARMLYEDGAGIKLVTPKCDGTTQEPVTLIPGGTSPDWSAADVPTSRPAAPPVPVTPPKPAPKPTTPKNDTRADRGKTAKPGTAIAAIACRKSCTLSGKVVVSKKVAKRLGLKAGATLATGTARGSKKGSVKLKLTANAAGRKALAKLKGVKLELRVTVKEGGKTRRVTKTVTLA